MTAWILVIYMIAGGANGGITSQSIPGFTTEASCRLAMTEAKSHPNVTAFCIAVK